MNINGGLNVSWSIILALNSITLIYYTNHKFFRSRPLPFNIPKHEMRNWTVFGRRHTTKTIWYSTWKYLLPGYIWIFYSTDRNTISCTWFVNYTALHWTILYVHRLSLPFTHRKVSLHITHNSFLSDCARSVQPLVETEAKRPTRRIKER